MAQQYAPWRCHHQTETQQRPWSVRFYQRRLAQKQEAAKRAILIVKPRTRTTHRMAAAAAQQWSKSETESQVLEKAREQEITGEKLYFLQS